jgi:hypothetical protein
MIFTTECDLAATNAGADPCRVRGHGSHQLKLNTKGPASCGAFSFDGALQGAGPLAIHGDMRPNGKVCNFSGGCPSKNPSRRRFVERKAPAGATDMSINIGARAKFECEVAHIPSNAFCRFRCPVCDRGNMRANGVHWAWISAVCTAVVQTEGRRRGVLFLSDLAGLPCRDAIGVRWPSTRPVERVNDFRRRDGLSADIDEFCLAARLRCRPDLPARAEGEVQRRLAGSLRPRPRHPFVVARPGHHPVAAFPISPSPSAQNADNGTCRQKDGASNVEAPSYLRRCSLPQEHRPVCALPAAWSILISIAAISSARMRLLGANVTGCCKPDTAGHCPTPAVSSPAGVENFTDLGGQLGGGDGLLDHVDAGIEPPVMHDGVSRISRHEQDPEVGLP